MKPVKAFHVKCLQQIVLSDSTDRPTFVTQTYYYVLASVSPQISRRRIAVFGHIARLVDCVPVHQAVRLQIDAYIGRLSNQTCKRQLGHSRKKWLDLPKTLGVHISSWRRSLVWWSSCGNDAIMAICGDDDGDNDDEDLFHLPSISLRQ